MKKREVERIEAGLQAQFLWRDRVNTGTLVDVSEKGMLMSTAACPPLRARFEVNIPLEDEVMKIPVKVRRVIKKEHLYEAVGLEVINPSRKYLEFIGALRWKQLQGTLSAGRAVRLYVCRICKHISFDSAPMHCPICSASIEYIEKSPFILNKAQDPSRLSDIEKSHIPSITFSKLPDYTEVHINVGEVEHHMSAEHYIQFLDVYMSSHRLNKNSISRVIFASERMRPSASLRFTSSDESTIKVVSKCTSHGSWVGTAAL